MAERFDSLFAGISEESAIQQVETPAEQLQNPSPNTWLQRLGACRSRINANLGQMLGSQSRQLIRAHYRRKAMRHWVDAAIRAHCYLVNCLSGDDEIAILMPSTPSSRLAAT